MLGGDWTDGTMTDFKWRHFQGDVILWAVRWYCRYPISYRDLEEMLAERGISVDHTTIYRWVQCYAPEMEKRLRCLGAAGRRQVEIDRVAPLVDCPVQVGPLAPHLDVGFIQAPARIKA